MNNIRVILIEPKYSGNVGACSRVLTNFGVKDFCVVNPKCDVFDKQARLFGKGPARQTLLHMKSVKTFREAIEGCHHSLAFTRRRGEWHPSEVSFQNLPSFALSDPNKKVALVFGREDNCLQREEMLLCTEFCEIPTSPEMPTMNLSHSVAAVLSRIYGEKNPVHNDESEESVPLQEFEDFMDHLKDTLVDMNFTKGGNPERMHGRMRRVLQRAQMSERDLALFRAFMSKIQVKIGTRINRNQKISEDEV